jgi:hypothetical protein
MKKLMWLGAVLLMIGWAVVVAPAQTIRRVDFRNFTYRAYCAENQPFTMRVRRGHYDRRGDDPVHFVVERAKYGDITGDGHEEAIVLTNCDQEGTGYFSEGFIYTLRRGKPVLLTRVPGGDRAQGGLYGLTIRHGLVVVESYAAKDNGGVCCPDYIDTTRYRWNGHKLVQVGAKSRRDYKSKD